MMWIQPVNIFAIFIFIILIISMKSSDSSETLTVKVLLCIFLACVILFASYDLGHKLAKSKDSSRSISEIRASMSYEKGKEDGIDSADSAFDDGWNSHQAYDY